MVIFMFLELQVSFSSLYFLSSFIIREKKQILCK